MFGIIMSTGTIPKICHIKKVVYVILTSTVCLCNGLQINWHSFTFQKAKKAKPADGEQKKRKGKMSGTIVNSLEGASSCTLAIISTFQHCAFTGNAIHFALNIFNFSKFRFS